MGACHLGCCREARCAGEEGTPPYSSNAGVTVTRSGVAWTQAMGTTLRYLHGCPLHVQVPAPAACLPRFGDVGIGLNDKAQSDHSAPGGSWSQSAPTICICVFFPLCVDLRRNQQSQQWSQCRPGSRQDGHAVHAVLQRGQEQNEYLRGRPETEPRAGDFVSHGNIGDGPEPSSDGWMAD